jgi:hypothetical protein
MSLDSDYDPTDEEQFGITAVISVWRRPQYYERMLYALANQTHRFKEVRDGPCIYLHFTSYECDAGLDNNICVCARRSVSQHDTASGSREELLQIYLG